ncbi:ribonuclease P protein subunit [Candidatus Geothermarchaeota archaeon]|nr:MAG: ribonuclease P protein subunit [Candidatus Geothermarchaeota archaeon]
MKKLKIRRICLLGLKVKVKHASNLNLEGISGLVIDETRNMLIVRKDDGKMVKIPKKVCVFEFEINGRKYLVDGVELIGRIERRITGR